MAKIVVFNFGGTSSKVSLYEDNRYLNNHTINYTADETRPDILGSELVEINKQRVLWWMESLHITPADVDAYAVRLGGMFNGGDGGTFPVEGELLKYVNTVYDPHRHPAHPTQTTIALVEELQKDLSQKRPCYATDPSSINQFLPEARLTGHPLFTKRAAFHALNQRAAARKAAAEMGGSYFDFNFVVAHMGGGVSVGAHQKGRIIDVNNSTGDGDGAFSADRSGTLPTGALVHLCFSGKYTEREIVRMLKGDGGLKAYLGTTDLREVEKRIDQGDQNAELVFNALAYQIAREIGACCATLCGKVDAIVMTGGMSNSRRLITEISRRVEKLAPVRVYAGEFENEALALGAWRVMTGQEAPAVYMGEGDHELPLNPA